MPYLSACLPAHLLTCLPVCRIAPSAPCVYVQVVSAYVSSKRRLVVLGYNATLTTAVEAPRAPKRHYDQIKALSRVNPRILAALEELCADPANEVLIFSGR